MSNLNFPVMGTIYFPAQWGIYTFYELKEVSLPDFALGQVKADAVHDFGILVSEAGGFECSTTRDITFIYDITIPRNPRLRPLSKFRQRKQTLREGWPVCPALRASPARRSLLQETLCAGVL